jgi:hypothetical protein
MAGAGVEAMLKEVLSVHRWQGGELDRGEVTRHTRVCQRTLPRSAKGRLRPGLDGALSTPVAGSAKQPTQGLIAERLAPSSGRRCVEQTATSTRPHTTRAAMRRLPGVGAWVEALRREGIDAWMAQ